MYKIVTTVMLIVTFGLVGCASHTPPTVDLSDSIYRDVTVDKFSNMPISWLSVVNYAPEEKARNAGNAFAHKQFVIMRNPDPRVIVEEDLERYFSERLVISPDATRSVRVQIDKVRIHFVEPPHEAVISGVPILGLFYVFATAGVERMRDYVMHVKLSITVKEKDEVVAMHHPDILVSLKRGMKGIETENATYKELFSHYRQKLFTELDEQLIGKHFSKPVKLNRVRFMKGERLVLSAPMM